MGLFGGGNSKKTTTNNDNRVVNDYANASWDNSVNHEYLQETNGDFNNNTGNITMIDPNAIEGALSISENAMGRMAGVNADSLNFADGVMSNALSSVNGIAGDSLEFASGALDSGFDAAQNMGMFSIDAAMNFADNATLQQQSNNQLAMALAGNAREQSAENNQALTDGFEQMMQFTEQFSRSDGAAVAATNTKTVGFMVAGLVAVLFLSKGLK